MWKYVFFRTACLRRSRCPRFLSNTLLYLGVGELSLALLLEPCKLLWFNCCWIIFLWWKERLQFDTYSITIKTLYFKIPLKFWWGLLLWGHWRGTGTRLKSLLNLTLCKYYQSEFCVIFANLQFFRGEQNNPESSWVAAATHRSHCYSSTHPPACSTGTLWARSETVSLATERGAAVSVVPSS